MGGRVLVIFVLVLIALVHISNSEEDKVDENVIDFLENNEEVGVVVKLKDETGTFTTTEVETNEVIDDLGNDFEKENEYENVFKGFSGNVTAEQLEVLKDDDRVEKIYYDYPVKALLSDTVLQLNTSLINAKAIHGLNITGRDQSVCIIDTGVNYNDASLGGGFGAGYKVIAGYDYVNDDTNPIDDNGHGTHIAGIVAGSGSVKGMAPGANIVALKVLDSGGNGGSGDVVSGIDWCINATSTYNISVISLSIALLNGSVEGIYSTYCDENDAVVNAANEGRESGIFVVAAAGNRGSSVGISSPACGSNVTAVGAVDKNDGASDFNSGNIMDFWAPGKEITSVGLSGGSSSCAGGTCNGTSMAAPHIAGIAALMFEYKKVENGTTLKPTQITEIMNKTGINITRASVTKPRVDAYDSIRLLDTFAPYININISNLDVYYNTTNLTIGFSAIDPFLDYAIINVSYPNGTRWFNSTGNVTIPFSNLTISGNYTVTLVSNDSLGNVNITTTSFRIITPAVALQYPTNYLNLSTNDVEINCSVQSQFNLVNLSVYHNLLGTFAFNQTYNATGNLNSTNFTFNNVNDGVYSYNCRSSDNSNNTFYSANNYTFTIDATYPGISLLSPSNASTQTSSSITFNYNATDNFNLTSCSLLFNGATDQTDTTITQGISQSFTKSSIDNGDYTWGVNCLDIAGNQNTSTIYNITVSVSSSGSPGGNTGGGGGGGGGGGKVSSASTVETPEEEEEPAIEEREYEEREERDIEDLIEEIESLKKGLELVFEELNEIKSQLREPSAGELNINRKAVVGIDNAKVSLIIKYDGEKEAENFIVYDEVPKNFAEDADMIAINAGNGGVTVVEKDPVFMFTYKNVMPGEEQVIEYSLSRNVPLEVIDEFDKPIVLVRDLEQPEVETPLKESEFEWKYFIISAGILIVLTAGILFFRRRKNNLNTN